MTFRGDISRSGGKARKGGGGGRGMAVGGGLGGLLLVGLFVLLGGNPAQIPDMLGQGEGQGQAQLETGESFDHCQSGEDANTYDDCRLLFTMSSTTAIWKEVLPTQAG